MSDHMSFVSKAVMGATEFFVKLKSADRKTAMLLWRQHCRALRRHSTIMHIFSEMDRRVRMDTEYDPPLESMPDGTLWYHLKKVPDEDLGTNAETFGDFWTYDGIPCGAPEKFRYIRPVPRGCASEEDVRARLVRPSGRVCALRAIVFQGCTYVGGWVPW